MNHEFQGALLVIFRSLLHYFILGSLLQEKHTLKIDHFPTCFFFENMFVLQAVVSIERCRSVHTVSFC